MHTFAQPFLFLNDNSFISLRQLKYYIIKKYETFVIYFGDVMHRSNN